MHSPRFERAPFHDGSRPPRCGVDCVRTRWRSRWLRVALSGGSALAILLGVGPGQPIVLAAGSSLNVNGGSSSCSDGGPGSPSQPYCTIGKAAQLAQAGDTVVVSGGTYTGTSVNPTNTGTSGNPITFTASAGVTISGGVDAFAISGRSYIVIDGFTISSTANYGIAVSSSSQITISNNRVTGAGQAAKGFTAAGISLSGTTSSLVTHNTTDHNSDHGIYLWGGSANNTISFNEASFNAEGWQRNANGINVIGSGSTGNTLFGNVLHDNEDSGLQFFSGANNGLAAQNVSYNNGDHGIDDYNVTGGVLIGNSIYHNCADGINVEGTSGSYTVMNNIAVDNAVYPAYNGIKCDRRKGNIGIYDSAPASTTVDYNLVNLTTSGSQYMWANTSYATPAAFQQGAGQEAHGTKADPKWVNSASANFRLLPGSPAIDTANSGGPSQPSVDADGNPRVDDPSTQNTGAGPRAYDDRGAYEFQQIDTQAPSVPTGLAASAASQSRVNLTWNPSNDNVGVAGYTVYRNGSQLAVVTGAAYADTTASPSTTYSYAVDAFDWANNHSPQTSQVSATTPAPDTQPPSVPTGLSAPGVSSVSVSLAWSVSTDNIGVTGYSVYRNGVNVGASPTTSFTDTGLASATSYTYRVDAYDAAGNHSAQSAAVVATTGVQSIAYVQSGAYSKGARVTSTTFTLKGHVGAGDLLTGLFTQWDAAGQVQVSDSVNGPWTRANGITFSSGKGDVALYYLANSLASTTGLTITISASAPTYLSGAVGEYSGVATSAPLDQVAIHSGSGTSVDSGPTASVAAGELVFGALTANSSPGTVTAGTSQGLAFTMRSSYSSIYGADIVAGSPGTQDARFTISNSVTWYAVAAAFLPKVTTTDTLPPATPIGLTATNLTGSVALSWGASTDNVGVTGYTVFRNGSVIATVGGSVLSFSDTSVASTTTYGYSVDAFDAAGNHSAPSAAVNDTTNDWTPPSVPGNLTATATSPTQVNLTWAASTDNIGVGGYTVYRNGSQLATVGAGILAYSDTSAVASTSYDYTVDAIDSTGNHSAQSQPATVTTPSPPDSSAPSTPGGLAALAPGSTQVNLSWNASTDNVGVSGYTVYRNGSTLATVSGTTLSYTDSAVTASTSYSYAVDAFDAAGNHSAQSAPATVTTPAPAGDTTPPTTPAGLAASAPGPTQVNLTWNASTDSVGVTGYTVYRNGSTLGTVSGATRTYTDTTVAAATNYSYTVDAFDAAGNHSSQSAPGAVHVPGQPKFVQGKVVTTGSRVTTTTVTLGAVAQKDLLVGWFGQFDSTGHVSVSDNVNGAWTRSASTTWSGTAGDIALYYFANSAAAPGGLTITITATNATYLQGGPAEYSGVAIANPLDQVVIAKGTGTSADSGLTAATGSGELVYGGMLATNGAGTLAPGTSQGVTFVKRAQSTSGSQGVEDIVTTAAGQQHSGFTFPTSVPWFMVCAVFKPA
jgi:parallel beta-helix repeat protein